MVYLSFLRTQNHKTKRIKTFATWLLSAGKGGVATHLSEDCCSLFFQNNAYRCCEWRSSWWWRASVGAVLQELLLWCGVDWDCLVLGVRWWGSKRAAVCVRRVHGVGLALSCLLITTKDQHQQGPYRSEEEHPCERRCRSSSIRYPVERERVCVFVFGN